MKTEHMMIAGLAGYMMMKKGNSGLGGLGQAQSLGQAPTGYSIPTGWTEIDFNNSLQGGEHSTTKFYGHEIHSWYTNKVFTNNPSDMNRDRAWEFIERKLRKESIDGGRTGRSMSAYLLENLGEETFNKLADLFSNADFPFRVWSKNFSIAVTAKVEKKQLALLQPHADSLLTTMEYVQKVLIPSNQTIAEYHSTYKKGVDALIKSVKPVTVTYPPIPN